MREERRSTQRYSVRLSAEVQHGGWIYTSVTRDLSTSGVSLEGKESFPVGTSLDIALFLVTEDIEDPSFPPLKLRGTVAWSQGDEGAGQAVVGIRFEGVTQQQNATLTRLVQALAAR